MCKQNANNALCRFARNQCPAWWRPEFHGAFVWQIRNCHWCDPAYGEGVAKALGLTVEDALNAREVDPALGQPGLL